MRLPLEGTLLEKLRKIEALHAGTKVGYVSPRPVLTG
jgi:hypothetical protein